MSAAALAENAWMAALTEPIGLGIIVADPIRAKSHLYAARKRLTASGLDLAPFTIRTSADNPAFELWIVRTAPEPTPD